MNFNSYDKGGGLSARRPPQPPSAYRSSVGSRVSELFTGFPPEPP